MDKKNHREEGESRREKRRTIKKHSTARPPILKISEIKTKSVNSANYTNNAGCRGRFLF